MIELKKVSKEFKSKKIFEDLSLTIESGKCIGIIGENGCGKSVLLKLICGFSKPDSGEIIIDGERLGDRRDFIPNAGVIINSPNFIGHYTGYENLLLLASIRKKIGKKEIGCVLNRVGLSSAEKTKVKNYSLGMKQRLRIAQAVMEEPDYLILDEPMNALDNDGIAMVNDIINEFHANGKTILMTSHNPLDIERHCDLVLKVNNCSVSACRR
ncbi:MAG: ABC transporter ATP-binding protein [Ruminococcaceae bacterium]|nr:ABC transporter ATP-binding protein [Oscillospiraceae bacterium]